MTQPMTREGFVEKYGEQHLEKETIEEHKIVNNLREEMTKDLNLLITEECKKMLPNKRTRNYMSEQCKEARESIDTFQSGFNKCLSEIKQRITALREGGK